MDDGIELPHVSRQLEAGDLSPPGAAVTSPTGIRQSEMRPGDDTDNRLNATKCAYDTLDEGFFRLVRITQAPSTGRIECWTEQFSLQDPPPYTALSYACGPRPANFNLKLNGRDWNVRQNLAHFLRQHTEMDRDSEEWLWIDAICINHANDPERTHQVRLMADIYGKATRVIVWLGTAYEQSDDAMMGLLESKGDEQALELIPWILAVVLLCSRPYWCRLWVLQELKLAKRKYLMCGSMVIPWHDFERFILRVDEKFRAPCFSPSSWSTEDICSSGAMRMIMLARTPVWTSLLDLMEKSRHLQCEEPRDRVYALCGLATAEAASIGPNYENDIPVFLNTLFRHHIEQIPEVSIRTVTSTCERLQLLFGTPPGTIFEFHSPKNHLPGQPGIIYERLCTSSIDMPGLTLLWAMHYEHARVQELIKMVHRLRTPSSCYMFFGLQAVGLVVALHFVIKEVSDSTLVTAATSLFGGVIAVNALAILLYFWCYSRLHHSKNDDQAGRNGEWKNKSTRSFYMVLWHHSTWISPWWIPFIVSEVFFYIAARPFRPLKRWYFGFYFRWRHEVHARNESIFSEQ